MRIVLNSLTIVMFLLNLHGCGSEDINHSLSTHSKDSEAEEIYKEIDNIAWQFENLLDTDQAELDGDTPQKNRLQRARHSLRWAYEFTKLAGRLILKGEFKNAKN